MELVEIDDIEDAVVDAYEKREPMTQQSAEDALEDILAETAWTVAGVIGSRITGGGFGGCTVSIVKDEAIDTFKETLTRVYEEKVGKTPEFYVVEIGDGPSRLI